MTWSAPAEPPLPLVRAAVEMALLEDLGRAGDITSAAIIPAGARAEAVIAARQAGVLAGMPLARAAFAALDGSIAFEAMAADGDGIAKHAVLARVAGPARAVLAAERVALNFLTHLSGIATATRSLVDRIAHTRARVTCTRKTTPGLRAFEKYAVRCGGGSNHRYGLDDAILIKDNHIAVAGGIRAALEAARANAGHTVKIEIEVGSLDELREALDGHPDVVMLDNLPPETLREAVRIAEARVVLEASGGIALNSVAAVAEAGVDFISSGWITHSAPALDLGLDVTVSR